MAKLVYFVTKEGDEVERILAENGDIAGAALDVYTTEPVEAENELLTMENVLTTPHSAANTPDARLRAQIACAENILAAFRGERPAGALNTPKK